MKKGRHRRFEEARALKRGPDIDIEKILEDRNSPFATTTRSDDAPEGSASDADDELDDDEYDSWTNPDAE